jgi:NTE family protein
VTRRVVCVLSGGGARAAAHIGAIRALQEYDLAPAHFVGTSMGAVIGACFGSGLSYDEVLRRVSTVSRSDVASFSPSVLLGPFGRSLLRARPFRETLGLLVPADSFDALRVPVTVTAVDASNGDLVLFGPGGRSHVPLLDALYASCALPLYYPPALIGDREYVDGGLRAVLPMDVAMQFAPDLVVGIHVGPSRHDQPPAVGIGAEGMVAAHRRALRIMMAVQAEETIRRWSDEMPAPHVVVLPKVTRAGTFALDRIVEYVEQGYRGTVRALNTSGVV